MFCVEKKNQLDVTECFIALTICSTCFGHFYAHHQELETIFVLLPPMVCSAWLLVVGVRCRAAGYASWKRDAARLRRAASLFQDACFSSLRICNDARTNTNQEYVLFYNLEIFKFLDKLAKKAQEYKVN